MLIYSDIDQLVTTTHDTVNKLSQYKNGGDALLLYFRYIQQKKMQENNQTLSSDDFMIKAMGRGRERFYNTKKLLVDEKLIEVIKKTDEQGKIAKRYIKVNYVIQSSRVRENQSVDSPESGKPGTNTLVEKINTLVEKENTLFESFWESFPHARGVKKKDAKKIYETHELGKSIIFQEMQLLKKEIEYGIVDIKYVPATERRIAKLVHNDQVMRLKLVKVCEKMIEQGVPAEKKRELRDMFTDYDIAQMFAEIRDRKKNLLIDSIKNEK